MTCSSFISELKIHGKLNHTYKLNLNWFLTESRAHRRKYEFGGVAIRFELEWHRKLNSPLSICLKPGGELKYFGFDLWCYLFLITTATAASRRGTCVAVCGIVSWYETATRLMAAILRRLTILPLLIGGGLITCGGRVRGSGMTKCSCLWTAKAARWGIWWLGWGSVSTVESLEWLLKVLDIIESRS